MTQIRKIKSVFICVICVPLLVSAQARANTVSTASLRDEVNTFLGKELAVHLAAIKSLDPPPDLVLGVPTTGEFSWGTFMRSLAAYSETTGNRELAGRDLAKWVGQIGLIESRAGSKAFSQLYAALALRHFGRDLKTNPLWQSLSADEQKAWRSLLNPERFYDPKTNRVINLAENYLGVAARIASIGYELASRTIVRFSTNCSTVLLFRSRKETFTLTMRRQQDVSIVTQTSTRATFGKRRRLQGARICSTSCDHR